VTALLPPPPPPAQAERRTITWPALIACDTITGWGIRFRPGFRRHKRGQINVSPFFICNAGTPSCLGLSSELQNSCIPRKTSREYILLSTYERKTAFSALYRRKRTRNRLFFRRFGLFLTAVKAYMTSWNLSTTTPGPGAPPASSRRTKQFWSRPHGL
jgi:hypothetical protein